MGKDYIKKLLILLSLTLISGLLLMNALYNEAFTIDRTIILTRHEMLFIIISALIVMVGLFLLMINLFKERMRLSSIDDDTFNNNLNQSSFPQPTPKNEVNEAPQAHQKDRRFFMLNQIDKRALAQKAYHFENGVTLKSICDEFRHFAAGQLGLYYDISDIRRFVGGLAVSHIMILQGMSGTGKTSLAYAFGDYLKNPTTVVPIQPMWKERTDLIGYYNEFTKKFNETTLLQKLYDANHNDQMYITVLDEMNIARVEYYFAEFLSLLELPDENKRHLDVISDVWENDPSMLNDGKLVLPKNMWFIGTANNDDSTFSISDKVYDRAMVINLDKKSQPFMAKPVKGRSVSEPKFTHLINQSRKQYALSNRNKRRLQDLDQYLMKHYQITFGNRIMKQINDYVPVLIACGGDELQALDDIISKKVLRKLETKNMVYVKNTAPSLITFIEELFGETAMAQCKSYIKNIEINV